MKNRANAKTLLSTLLVLTMPVLAVTLVALASDVDVAVVDVTAPTGSVTLAPGGSGSITINMTVTGNQAGTATFKVYTDWSLSGGTFTGSNPETFTVLPRGSKDPATTFETYGTVTVASGQADGTFTLAVGAFDITNDNQQGAKLAARNSSNYQVTVEAPATPTDTTPPVVTVTLPGSGTYLLNESVSATWTAEDEPDGSGLATDPSGSVELDTSSVGPKTLTIPAGTAVDNAGNESLAVSITYNVVYGFEGPQPPYAEGKAYKIGSAIPLKWQYTDVDGVAPSSDADPRVYFTHVSMWTSAEEATLVSAPGTSDYQYDDTTYTWQRNWKTTGLTKGTYYIWITSGASGQYDGPFSIQLK